MKGSTSARFGIRLRGTSEEQDERPAWGNLPLGKPLLEALERMSCGAVVLDASGSALQVNPTALRLFQQETGSSSRPAGDLEWVHGAITRLLNRAETRLRMSEEAWITIPREDRRDLVLHAVPLGNGADPGPHTVLILVDLDSTPLPRASVLQRMFALTPAEAKLAIEIASGQTPAEVAAENLVSMATVRSQLASVLAKTQTGRQAELVALLARVAILP